MKHLIKSSFKSFFQNKFSVILLSIIVFITSAAFTMFQSTSNAFDRSYNNVVTQGNLHDFTIKEKYPEAGDIYVGDPDLTSTEHIDKKIQNLKAPNILVDNDKNIYITQPFVPDGSYKGMILVDINDIVSNPATLDAKLIYTFRTGFFGGFKSFKIDDHDNRDKLMSLLSDPTLKVKNHNGYDIVSQDVTIDNTATSLHLDYDGHKKDAAFNFASFYKVIEGLKSVSFKTISGDYNHYSFVLDSKSNQMSKDAFAKFDSKDWANVLGLPTNDFLVDNQYKGTADEFTHAMTHDFKPFDYNSASTSIKTSLVKKVGNNLSQQMKDNVLQPYIDDGTIAYKDVKSLYVTSDKQAFRFVNEKDANPTVDKLKLFSGFGLPEQDDHAIMKAKLKSVSKDIKDTDIVDKGYSMIASWQESFLFGLFHIPRAASVLDLSSFAVVVSPSYASENSLKALSRSEYNNISQKLKTTLDDENHTFLDVEAVLAPYKNNIVWAQSTPYLVTGVGITPDFSYPIVDVSNPIPDSSNQAILYTNGNGYNRIEDAFRGNSTENYLAVKVNKGDPEKVMNEINEKLKVIMNWPAGIQPARMTNDTNEKVILAPQRITFLQTIKNTVSTISWVTILLMILFTAFIVGLVVKKKIASRTKQLAILMANGYTKMQIAASMMVIGLIVGGVSTILGYVVGHWLQFAFISIFTNYWTLPIWETQFSWLSLVMTVIVPIIGIAVLAFFISLWQLRGSLISKLNGSSSKTKGALSNALVRGAAYVGIKTKVSVSIFATNISKMVMALIAFTMTIVVGSLTFNTFGKFDYALNQSENKIKYDFQIDLASPTKEAGMYKMVNLDDMFKDKNGATVDLDQVYIPIDKHTKDKPLDVSDIFYATKDGNHLDHIFPHVPTKPDEDGEKNDALYLKNRIQFKALLNPWLGAMGSGASPWDIARNMMPENQKNQADKRFVAFLNHTKDVAEQSGISYSFMNEKWYDTLKKQGTLQPKDVEPNMVSATDPEMNESYLDFIAFGLQTVISEYDHGQRDATIPFFLTYGNVLADNDDEQYTYISSTNVYKNFNDKTIKEDLIVRGISPSSQNIILNGEAKQALFNSTEDYKNNNEVDIVINKYFAKTHRLSVGDEFSSTVDNHADLTDGSLNSKYIPNVKYKVVSIQNSFDEGRVFTSQDVADEVLGWGANSGMFNGIYSQHPDELLFQNLPLYAPSGVYPASDTLSPTPTSPADKALDSLIKSGNLPNKNIGTYSDYLLHYGKSPMIMTYSSVDWATATDFKFHSVLKLSSSLLWMIQSITLFIALLFVALISSMIISDNKKFISTLKVLGYRRNEISRMFITTFLPSLLIAIAITIPVAFGILAGIQAALIGFGHVLIPLTIAGWEVVAAVAVLVIGFLIVYWASSRELRNTSLLKAFE